MLPYNLLIRKIQFQLQCRNTFLYSPKLVLANDMAIAMSVFCIFCVDASRNLRCFSLVEDKSFKPDMKDPPLLEDVELDIAEEER